MAILGTNSHQIASLCRNIGSAGDQVSLPVCILVDGSIWDYPSVGDKQTPLQTRDRPSSAQYSLCEEIARGQDVRMAISTSTNAAQAATADYASGARNEVALLLWSCG
jgi:hypothetical protein